MKNVLIHIALFFLYNNCYAANDSLPDCINTMKISTESVVTEYEYKGQRWFNFTKINPPTEPNISDKMYYTKFYDTGCKLVCTWTKGGIAGFNKVTPDTVQKEKIKKIEIIPKDSIKKYSTISNALPDTLVKMALAKNSSEVKEYLYQDKILYTFRYPFSYKPIPEKGSVTIDNPYYDESGKVILIYKSAIQATYTRAERWVPASVKRLDVKEVKNGVWIREKNNYKKLPLITDKEKDSIPPCINKLKTVQNPIFLTEYDYKGQRWFAFSRDGSSPESDLSDNLTYTTFYSTNCKIVCLWTKEGTTGLNKVTPDTVQKQKIKKIRVVSPETTQKQKEHGENVLPDTIVNLAHRKHSKWIEQRSSKGEYLYLFQDVTDTLTSKVTFNGSYYNNKGEIVFFPKQLGITYWWHEYNGKFIGTQFEPGYR